ncbi:MAG: glycosyltransferase [Nanoarchaeota archaeon]|nr:glycosyltransferase [Nanoarchaeota archaeon]
MEYKERDLEDLKAKIRNYRYDDFNLDSLIETKEKKGLKVGVAIPVKNEEETLATLIDDIRYKCNGLVDTIAVFDSGSTDKSELICYERNVPFIKDVDAANELGIRKIDWKSGKGMNLWASTHYLKDHDIISWIDADLSLKPEFIYGIVGPMIEEDNIVFSKGRYYRPETDNRVTRILAEPLMSALFPETRDFADPLCGIYGGRTEFLREIPFTTGYSVEVATLIHSLNKTNSENIAQVYIGGLKNREHDNRYLGKMSGSISFSLLKLAEQYGTLKLSDKVSANIIQQITQDGIEFEFVKEDIEDLFLPAMKTTEKKAKLEQLALVVGY